MTSKHIALFTSLAFIAAIMSMASVTAAQPADPAPAADPAAEPKPADAPADKPKEEATPEEEAEKTIEEGIGNVDVDPGAAVNAMVKAFQEGRWAAGIGLLLTILVWFTRRFIWKLIPKKALPWLTFGLAMVVTLAIELVSGIVWWKALIDGFLTCGAAMAFWSLVFKTFLGDKKPAESEG